MEENLNKRSAGQDANTILEKWYEDVVYSVAEQIELERQNGIADKAKTHPFPSQS